jgi:hypothetical protein
MIHPTETESERPLMPRLRTRLADLGVDILLAIAASLAWLQGVVDHSP